MNRGLFLLALTLSVIGFQKTILAQDPISQIPEEVRALVGTYTGSWTNFGIDENGQVVKKAAWTDTIRLENPVIKDNRAYVTSTDKMFFEGGEIPPMTVPGTEGYFLRDDGTLGDYYFEAFGQTYLMHKLERDTWAYVTPADPSELAQLGFFNILSAQHVLIKVVTDEQGTETHRISRITTVNWKDSKGEDRWLQYVSLQGFHKRLP